ncbi:C-reactive protein-like [Melanotaenia boesemani]|uniref:C-reactive protein-like n=1 Tax=Melanotaenia boesemani TaxID=1250792 RepID=UPI001C05EC3B|nr:C-reactive protein-like [Melanotaenia boesemani]
MVWFLLLLMVTCAASSGPTNLDCRYLVFPEKTATDHAKLQSCIHTFSAMTVCLRVKANLCRGHSLFSVATFSEGNAFLIFWDEEEDELEVYVQDQKAEFKGLKYDLNKWHSICVTWDSATGLVQLWFDGHYAVPKYVDAGLISSPCIILGQEQDNYCGGFEKQQSFVGEITDVHVWDYVIEICEIEHYLENEYFFPGNAVNWRELLFSTTGKVSVHCKQNCPDDSKDKIPKLSHHEGHQGLSAHASH